MIFQVLLLLSFCSLARPDCNLLKKPLSCQDVIKILNYHNEMRHQIAAGETSLAQAKDMWVLKWDHGLAEQAQAWANTCHFNKNENKPYEYGENLASYTAPKKIPVDVQRLVRSWYDEITNYDPDVPIDLYNTGHFTQLIWADTKYIGCGVSLYLDERNTGAPYRTLLVCNYKPAGNYPDAKPYVPFEWIRCERGIESDEYTGLCAHDREHSIGNYVPCSGNKLQPTAIFFTIFLLYGYYQFDFQII